MSIGRLEAVTSLTIVGSAGSSIGATRVTYQNGEISCGALTFGAAYIMAPPGLVDWVKFTCGTSNGDRIVLQFVSGKPGDELEDWNHPLTIGFYERAMRAQFETPPHPGFGFQLSTFGPNALNARFVVLAAEFDYSSGYARVKRFAANFEFVTDDHPNGPIRGTFFYNADPTNTIALSTSETKGPASVSGRVQLAAPAPAGGAIVELFSSEPDVVIVPKNVVIPAGAREASFDVSALESVENHSVDILSSYDGTASMATLNVTAAHQPITSIDLQGDPKAWIWPGPFHSRPDSIFWQRVAYSQQWIELNYADDQYFWQFTFRAPNGQRLKTGVLYSAPGGISDDNPPVIRLSAGDSLSLTGRGCNLNSGWFEIHDLVFDDSLDPPQVKSLSVSFAHNCEGIPNPTTVRGLLLFNEPTPLRTHPAGQ